MDILDKTYKKGYNERNAFLEGFNPVKTVKKNEKVADMLYKKETAIKNMTTTDKDDAFWVQYGIDLANSGR